MDGYSKLCSDWPPFKKVSVDLVESLDLDTRRSSLRRVSKDLTNLNKRKLSVSGNDFQCFESNSLANQFDDILTAKYDTCDRDNTGGWFVLKRICGSLDLI